MAFTIEATPETRNELFKELDDSLTDAFRDRADYDRRRIAIYNAGRNRVRPKTDPWPGCSNSSMPIITRTVERMTIHTMQTLAPRGSFTRVTAMPIGDSPLGEARDLGKDTSTYLAYQFRNRMKLGRRIEPFVRSGIQYGNGYGKLWWERREQMVRMVERFPAWNQVPKDPQQLEEERIENENAAPFFEQQVPVRESMDMLFQNEQRLEISDGVPAGEGITSRVYRFYDQEFKQRRTVHAEGFYDEDARENVILLKGRVIVCNQPQFTYIDLDDIYFSTETSSVKTCRYVFVRHPEITISDITQKKRRGIFDQLSDDDLEELKKRVPKNEVGATEREIKAHTPLDRRAPSVQSRADKVEGVVTSRREEIEVWEVFARLDFDDDGEDEELVIWFERHSRKILRIAHLYEEYSTNERPLVEWTLVPVGDRIMGIGVGELQMPLLQEINTLVNNRNDAAALALNPGGFYKPGSGFMPGQVRWRPGTWLPLDNPQTDAQPYVPVGNTRDTIQVEQFLMGFVEDLGVSNFTFGRSGPQATNAPRTARGTLAIIQQDAIKLDYVLMRLMPALEEICKLTLFQLRVNGPKHESYRVIGSDRVHQMSKEDLMMGYDFFFDLDSVSANKEVERVFASQVMQGALPIAMLPPERVTEGARRLTRRFLEAHEVKDAKTIIPDPPGFSRAPNDQVDEIFVMLKGIPVEPVMGDQHLAHIADMDAFETTETFQNMPPEWVEGIWKPHKQTHVVLQQQVERQMEQMLQGIGGGPGSPQSAGGANQGVAGLGGLAGETLGPEAPGATFTGGGV